MSPTSHVVDGTRAAVDPARPRAAGRADDELVLLEQPHRGAVGLEQVDRVLDDLVEHVLGIELTGELAARLRQPLRERPRAALELVQLAALEGAARRARHVPRQLQLLVREASLADEEDDREPRLGPRGCGSGTASSERKPAASADATSAVREAAVLRERP